MDAAHEHSARIADPGCACIGHIRDRLACREVSNHGIRSACLIVLMDGKKACRNLIVREQAARMAGVFGSHLGNTAQYIECAQSDVSEVTQWGGHDI